jgi:hypothetical protein
MEFDSCQGQEIFVFSTAFILALRINGYQGVFTQSKMPGRKAGAKTKNAWNYASTPSYIFMAKSLIK